MRNLILAALLASTLPAAAASGSASTIEFPARTEVRLGRYDARLVPDGPSDASVFELSLTIRGSDRGNLLELAEMSHGLQPFGFAASDFVRGISRSAFGRVRRIPIRGSRLMLRATLLRAVVIRAGSGRFPWCFRTLALALAIEPPTRR